MLAFPDDHLIEAAAEAVVERYGGGRGLKKIPINKRTASDIARLILRTAYFRREPVWPEPRPAQLPAAEPNLADIPRWCRFCGMYVETVYRETAFRCRWCGSVAGRPMTDDPRLLKLDIEGTATWREEARAHGWRLPYR